MQVAQFATGEQSRLQIVLVGDMTLGTEPVSQDEQTVIEEHVRQLERVEVQGWHEAGERAVFITFPLLHCEQVVSLWTTNIIMMG